MQTTCRGEYNRSGRRVLEISMMNMRAAAYGLCTFAPIVGPHLLGKNNRHGVGATASAKYCYGVWLRHLIHAKNCGLSSIPATVAELGPGSSIGCGLAALLSGASRYFALDAVSMARVDENLRVFDELVDLFRRRSGIPDENEFPDIYPPLETCEFPSTVLDDDLVGEALNPHRIQQIRDSISAGGMIDYQAPWSDPASIPAETVDFIFSQAVLEHVDDLPGMYMCMNVWLKSGGYVSHTIDFRSHGLANAWNGHWTCSDALWKVIRGRRQQLINRAPYSTHIDLLIANGFKVVAETVKSSASAIRRSDLSRRFAGMRDTDFTTSSAFVVGVKPESGTGQ